MYSQNNEDDILTKILPKEIGVVVEIGAFDGKTMSNSLLLIERGWNAFLVEPSPIAFSKIITLHGNNKNVDLLNCAILPNSEEKNKFKIIDFYESEMSLISTTSKKFSENDCVKEGNPWNNPPYKKILTTGIEIDVILEKVIEKWNRIDFLSIDAEGISSDIVMSINFSKYNIKCLCIELGEDVEKEYPYLQNFGYKKIHRTPENLILIK